jgi:uncharacterized paraquat-inducible protein A
VAASATWCLACAAFSLTNASLACTYCNKPTLVSTRNTLQCTMKQLFKIDRRG